MWRRNFISAWVKVLDELMKIEKSIKYATQAKKHLYRMRAANIDDNDDAKRDSL